MSFLWDVIYTVSILGIGVSTKHGNSNIEMNVSKEVEDSTPGMDSDGVSEGRGGGGGGSTKPPLWLKISFFMGIFG